MPKRVVTNRLGLALPIVKAIENDQYDPGHGDYSVTRLLEPARAVRLEETNVVVTDAADEDEALDGQLMHLLLERAANDLEPLGYIIEKRLYKPYLVPGLVNPKRADGSFLISAQIDVFDPATGALTDYKRTRVGALKMGLKDDFKMQVNFQAELLRHAGFSVQSGDLNIRLKDWTKMRVVDPSYPQAGWAKMVVPLLPVETVDEWVISRIRAHEEAKTTLPDCTPPERWNRPTWALIKPGRKTAVKVEDTEFELRQWMKANAKKAEGCEVVERPGQDLKCLLWCPVRSVCEFAKKLKPAEVTEDGMERIA